MGVYVGKETECRTCHTNRYVNGRCDRFFLCADLKSELQRVYKREYLHIIIYLVYLADNHYRKRCLGEDELLGEAISQP